MTADRPDIAASPAPRTARHDRAVFATAAAPVSLPEFNFAKMALAVRFWSWTTMGAALIALPTDRRWCSPVADDDNRCSGAGYVPSARNLVAKGGLP
jgi:hypothetical protein